VLEATDEILRAEIVSTAWFAVVDEGFDDSPVNFAAGPQIWVVKGI